MIQQEKEIQKVQLLLAQQVKEKELQKVQDKEFQLLSQENDKELQKMQMQLIQYEKICHSVCFLYDGIYIFKCSRAEI